MKPIRLTPPLRTTLNAAAFAIALTLGTPLLAAQPAANSIYGTPVQAGQADREIQLDSATLWVNVQQNETVRFIAGGQSFIWRFDTLGTPTFELNRIAPAGMLGNGSVSVYVAPDPRYIN